MLSIIFAVAVQAQSFWLPNATDNGIGLEVLKPSFEGEDETSFLSSAPTLSGRFRMGEQVLLAAELPFAYYNSEFSDGEFAVGNPYLGAILHNKAQSYFLEAGFRAPIASDKKYAALSRGYFADYDRFEAYNPDLLSFTLKNHYLRNSDAGFALRLMGGVSVLVPTGEDNFDTEALFDYAGHAGYENAKIQVLGGLTGRLIMTEEDLDFNERTVHHVGVFARYKADKVQPGLLFKVPVDDDFNDLVDFVFGLNVLVQLN